MPPLPSPPVGETPATSVAVPSMGAAVGPDAADIRPHPDNSVSSASASLKGTFVGIDVLLVTNLIGLPNCATPRSAIIPILCARPCSLLAIPHRLTGKWIDWRSMYLAASFLMTPCGASGGCL